MFTRIGKVSLEEVVGTDLPFENPKICFASPLFSNDFVVAHNGQKDKLGCSADSLPHSIYGKHRKALVGQTFVSCLLIFAITSIIQFIFTAFKIEPGFLPKENGFYKYLIFQLSALSAFVLGFASLFEIIFSRNQWLKRCVLNESVLTPGKEAKCNIDVAKCDLKELLRTSHVSIDNDRKFPCGTSYFEKVSKAISTISYKDDLIYGYKSLLSTINGNSSVTRTIVSFVFGFLIDILSFIDIYSDYAVFRNNMILSSILMFLLFPVVVYFSVKFKFEDAYIKLDALFYLYSYMFLEMPFLKDEKHLTYKIRENEHLISVEDTKEHCISELEKRINQHIYRRLVLVEGNNLIIYGLQENCNSIDSLS